MKFSERAFERIIVVGTLCCLAALYGFRGELDSMKWVATTLVIYVLARRNGTVAQS